MAKIFQCLSGIDRDHNCLLYESLIICCVPLLNRLSTRVGLDTNVFAINYSTGTKGNNNYFLPFSFFPCLCKERDFSLFSLLFRIPEKEEGKKRGAGKRYLWMGKFWGGIRLTRIFWLVISLEAQGRLRFRMKRFYARKNRRNVLFFSPNCAACFCARVVVRDCKIRFVN